MKRPIFFRHRFAKGRRRGDHRTKSQMPTVSASRTAATAH
jgi:hypothetical protein